MIIVFSGHFIYFLKFSDDMYLLLSSDFLNDTIEVTGRDDDGRENDDSGTEKTRC